MTVVQKRLCSLMVISMLVVGQPLPASESASCSAGPTPEARASYGPLERLALDEPLERILADPGRVAMMGSGPLPPASNGGIGGDVDPSGRWLPGYRPNTVETWREFEAWKAEQRRIIAELGSAVPAALQAPGGNLETGPVGSTVPDAEDAPTAVRRERRYDATSVDLRGLPSAGGRPDAGHAEERVGSADPRTGLPWDVYVRLKEEARTAPETSGAQPAEQVSSRAPGFLKGSFEAIHSAGAVPPDPIMTAGASHLVALVNQRYRVWDKNGVPLINEIALADFFARVPDCDSPFDVFVDYDEENDRYVMGGMNIVGGATFLCVAATASHDPATVWNAYSFQADQILTGTGIDYPHMAIGIDAVYIGGNMFDDGTGAFDSGRVFALDKTAMYDGDPVQVAEFGLGAYRTPQPARIRGFNTGQWPAPGTPQHIVAAQDGSGEVRVYRWTDPFVSDPVVYGDVVTTYLGMPPNAPEAGDTPTSSNFNDTSGGQLLDAEYRDGSLWSTRAVMCNVGGGDAESCVDWIHIDTGGPGPVLLDQQAGGAFGSADEFRYYPDLAVDRNGNMAIAYTKSGFSSFTEIWATGREAGDPAGALRNEVLQVAGAGNYTDSSGCAGTCDRWGDYTGMATDPDGCRFWYIGAYSDGGVGAWKTHIGNYKFDSCSIDSAVQSGKGTYACRDTMEVVVRDGIPIDAATVAAQTVVTSSTDSEMIPAERWIGSECSGATCVTWTALLALDTIAGAPDDGILQVANGETATIDYNDPHGGHASQSRQVTTTCQTGFDSGGYLILGGCEGSAGGEVFRDYIDAGEYVQYVYGVFNPYSAPAYTDVEATLSISGPLAGYITIGNPTIHLGALVPGQLAGAVFDVYLDAAAASFGLSQNDFILTLSSVGDGFDVPQVLTQTQVLQADDNVVSESICFNGETDEGFQSGTYVESYVCTSPPCGAGGVTVNSVAAPWARGEGCGSETRDDYPEMTCDVNGTFAYTLNDSSVSCGTFAQSFTEFTSDILYSPIMTPANTGNAPNGQPWFYSWQFAQWFFRADVSFTGDPTNPSIAATHLWTDDYLGGATPATNDINSFPYWQGNFWSPPNQDWDSGTPWDPQNPPANWFGHSLLGVIGEATPGRQWRWAIWQRDWDAFLGRSPIIAEATAGMAYDDLNFVYEQFHAEAQTTVCGAGDVPGRVSFDRLSYTECAGAQLEVSVLDGNAAGPVTVIVSSLGTGDSETLTLTGPGPRWAADLSYAMDAGLSTDDGVLFVTPNDSIGAAYTDASPAATTSATAALTCSEGSVVVTGVAAIDDSANAGDSDGIADTNEIVDFTLTLRNDGGLDLTNVEATIWSDDPDVGCVTKDWAFFGTLAADGGTATNSLVSDPFTFKVANGAECVNPSNPPSADFHVFITADGVDGAAQPQTFSFELDLNDLGSTLELSESFDGAQPAGWTHAIGPGDDDGVLGNGAAGLACGPYNDDWFWNASGGNGGGAFFCWQNPANPFPTGSYSDNLDAVLASAPVTIPAQGTGATVTFDHEYKLADAGSSGGQRYALDGAVVQYNVNDGPWMKVTDLAYDSTVFFNTYCNPLCNGGDEHSAASPPSTQDCFHEDPGRGERVFNVLGNLTQDWKTVTGSVRGLGAGDQLRFRWRVGSMNTDALGVSTFGGYGLDNVSIEANRFVCDTAVRPDVGCNVVFDGAGNLSEVCGNGNGLIDSDEQWDVDVTLRNHGSADAVATTADLEVSLGSAVQATVLGAGAFGTIPQRGGAATATYRFQVESAPVCADAISFDVANISDSILVHPDQNNAFTIQVGGVGANETGLQQINPAGGANSTHSAPLTPTFLQPGPVDVATLSYAFEWSSVTESGFASQSTDPLSATNGDATSALSPALSVPGGVVTSAVVDWVSLTSPGESATACTAVFLEAPDSSRVTLKALAAADASPYDVLSFYQTHGPGTYSIVVNERSGGGCNSDGILEGVTMAISGGITGNWTNNARVSLVNGGSSTILKDFGQTDGNPYDVRSIYDSFGPGTYEIRVEENAGGFAELESAALTVQSYSCSGSCSGLPAPPPVADGIEGSPMTVGKGVGPGDLDLAFDSGTCTSDHAVVLYGDLGDFSGYQGAVASGCDAGASGSATINQPGSYWFMLVWVNADGTAGPAGNGTGGARNWTASGFCGVSADDHADQVCN